MSRQCGRLDKLPQNVNDTDGSVRQKYIKMTFGAETVCPHKLTHNPTFEATPSLFEVMLDRGRILE